MTNRHKLFTVLIVLLLASLACSLTDNFGGSSSDDTADSAPQDSQPTQESQSPLINLFSDCKNPFTRSRKEPHGLIPPIIPLQGT